MIIIIYGKFLCLFFFIYNWNETLMNVMYICIHGICKSTLNIMWLFTHYEYQCDMQLNLLYHDCHDPPIHKAHYEI